MEPLIINDVITIPATDLDWAAARASGPGGQNVNKVSSKVELRFRLTSTTCLTEPVRVRLRQMAGSRLTPEGDLLIVCQVHREQHRNLDEARERLRELILQALVKPKRRVATKPTRASRERRVQAKRQHSETKRARSKRGGDDD
ncbi:MAG TPA: alternative ribosome rescue aminoacyl-tRNA hydrolase ArfB [Candidatus Ozemobacteraceae bacterium]|nr:alternative ribosome rescue aminoacyl-tRNA hydrolase ArfB [Candidatus Ozemobacteraceae bacterium]